MYTDWIEYEAFNWVKLYQIIDVSPTIVSITCQTSNQTRQFSYLNFDVFSFIWGRYITLSCASCRSSERVRIWRFRGSWNISSKTFHWQGSNLMQHAICEKGKYLFCEKKQSHQFLPATFPQKMISLWMSDWKSEVKMCQRLENCSESSWIVRSEVRRQFGLGWPGDGVVLTRRHGSSHLVKP